MRALSEERGEDQGAGGGFPHAPPGRPGDPSRGPASVGLRAGLANVFFPGSGLVLRGRCAMGAMLALAFTVGGVTACWGWLIVPLSIPPWLRGCGVALALAAWGVAQALLFRENTGEDAGRASDLSASRRNSIPVEPE